MSIPVDLQIEALVESHDRAMAKLHLGASPYDDEDEDAQDYTQLYPPRRDQRPE